MWKVSVLGAFFWCEFFSLIWTEYGDLQNKSRIHSECSIIWARTAPNENAFHAVKSEHCFIILIPLYCKFTVISCLNDCKGMKLVVPTHIVLLHQYRSIMALLAYMEQYSVKKFIMYSVLSTPASNTLSTFKLTHQEWTNSTLDIRPTISL